MSARYRNYCLVVLTLTYAVAFIDRQILSIAQEEIKIEMGLSDAQLGLLSGLAFSFFYVTAGIPIARLADRSVRRNVLAASMAIWSAMTAITALAQGYFHLFLARIGVGIGEGGCNPPSYSMIIDMFPPDRRASALSFYTIGPNIGLLFGFLFGGILVAELGWRMAFVFAGIPGFILAVVLVATVKEPARIAPVNSEEPATIGLLRGLKYLSQRRTLYGLSVAVAMSALVSYGSLSWAAPFLLRTYEMDIVQVGAILSLLFGIGGACGSFGSGILADYLAKRDVRWYLWLPGLVTVCFVPLIVFGFLASTQWIALSLLALPITFGAMFAGVSLTVLNTIAPSRLRATASSLFLLVTNLFGVGLGSLIIGLTSDWLNPSLGDASLQHALAVVLPIAAFIAAGGYVLAARSLRDDWSAELTG